MYKVFVYIRSLKDRFCIGINVFEVLFLDIINLFDIEYWFLKELCLFILVDNLNKENIIDICKIICINIKEI